MDISSQAFESDKEGFTKEVEVDKDGDFLAVDSIVKHSSPVAELPLPALNAELIPSPYQTSRSVENGGGIIKKKKKKKKRVPGGVSVYGSSCSSCSSSSQQKGLLVTNKRRIPKVSVGGGRRSDSDVQALALPLGMSIAAVVAQVLDRTNTAEENMSIDHLSTICTMAVKESLANVFGDRFSCFVNNFEKSFGSTLKTLRLINEASHKKGRNPLCHSSIESCSSEVASPTSLNKHGCSLSRSGINDCHADAVSPTSVSLKSFGTIEEIQENVSLDYISRELMLHGKSNQQLACVSPSILGSETNQSALRTFEKHVIEQARSNDLKTLEIGLIIEGLKLKESQLSLNSDSNHLERFKISMGISEASFKAEKFKNQLEETRYTELLRKCIDSLVAGLLIMSSSLVYGAYVYSYKRITEATASCTPSPQESKSWWMPKPVISINSGLHTLRCQVEVVSRMLFGVLMIVVVAYLLLQRSAASKQTMPVTFILLLLGIACGFAGKLCVDTLGGNGYLWLLYWETLCLLHFFANVCTSVLFRILHGPISVSQWAEGSTMFPYWIRRFLFYAIMLLFLPLFCGLMPFASPSDWKDHICSIVINTLLVSYGE